MNSDNDFRRETDQNIASINTTLSTMSESVRKIFNLLDGDDGLVADNRANKQSLKNLWKVVLLIVTLGVPAALTYMLHVEKLLAKLLGM